MQKTYSIHNQLSVIEAILSIDPDNRAALAAVSELLVRPRPLTDERFDERKAVLNTLSGLASLGTSVRGAAPALLHALDDESPFFRVHVARALVQIGNHDDKLVAVLIELLQSKDFELVVQACSVLQTMGPAAKLAVPQLVKIVSDPKTDVRRTVYPFPQGDLRMECATTLWSFEPQNPLPAKVLLEPLHECG